MEKSSFWRSVPSFFGAIRQHSSLSYTYSDFLVPRLTTPAASPRWPAIRRASSLVRTWRPIGGRAHSPNRHRRAPVRCGRVSGAIAPAAWRKLTANAPASSCDIKFSADRRLGSSSTRRKRAPARCDLSRQNKLRAPRRTRAEGIDGQVNPPVASSNQIERPDRLRGFPSAKGAFHPERWPHLVPTRNGAPELMQRSVYIHMVMIG